MNSPHKDTDDTHHNGTADSNILNMSFNTLYARVNGPVGPSGKTLKVVTAVEPMTPINKDPPTAGQSNKDVGIDTAVKPETPCTKDKYTPPNSPINGDIGNKEEIAGDIPEYQLKRVKRSLDLTDLLKRLEEVEIVDPCIDGLLVNNSDVRADTDSESGDNQSDVEYFSDLALGFEMQSSSPVPDQVEFGLGSIIFDAGNNMPTSDSTTPDLTASVTTFDPQSPVLTFSVHQDNARVARENEGAEGSQANGQVDSKEIEVDEKEDVAQQDNKDPTPNTIDIPAGGRVKVKANRFGPLYNPERFLMPPMVGDKILVGPHVTIADKTDWRHFASLRRPDGWVSISDLPLTTVPGKHRTWEAVDIDDRKPKKARNEIYVPSNQEQQPTADLIELARIREALQSKKPLCGGHFARSFDSVGPGRQSNDVWVKPTMRGIDSERIRF